MIHDRDYGERDFRPPARRRRQEHIDQQITASVEQAIMASDSGGSTEPEEHAMPVNLSRNAMLVADGVEKLQAAGRASHERATQLQAALNQAKTDISRLLEDKRELSEALDKERQRRIYVESVMTNIGGLVADVVSK